MTDKGERRERAEMDDEAKVLDAEDTELENELRGIAARVDPVPAGLLAAAEAAFTWRTVDAELAELIFDSRADAESLAVVRGGGEPRLLTFHAAELTVEVEVTRAGPEHRLVGQLLPPGPARVQVRHPDGVLDLDADELGRFIAERVAPGPVSLRCERGGEGQVVTDWVTV